MLIVQIHDQISDRVSFCCSNPLTLHRRLRFSSRLRPINERGLSRHPLHPNDTTLRPHARQIVRRCFRISVSALSPNACSNRIAISADGAAQPW